MPPFLIGMRSISRSLLARCCWRTTIAWCRSISNHFMRNRRSLSGFKPCPWVISGLMNLLRVFLMPLSVLPHWSQFTMLASAILMPILVSGGLCFLPALFFHSCISNPASLIRHSTILSSWVSICYSISPSKMILSHLSFDARTIAGFSWHQRWQLAWQCWPKAR